MNELKRLTLEMMFQRIVEQEPAILDNIRYSTDFAIAKNCGEVLRIFVDSSNAPFLLEDYRMGFVLGGYMRTVINLQECLVKEGDILVITPGTVVEPLEMSGDFSVTGMGFSAERFRMIHDNNLPAAFHGQHRHRTLHVDKHEIDLIGDMFLNLWNMTANEAINDTAIDSMAKVISYALNDFFVKCDASDYPQGQPHNVGYNMLQRFITLVNEHCREHRQLDFYADRICVTKRHLGTVVQQTSGMTAKEWIDKAVITAAKVMLRHTDQSVQQISDALHFPTASFFCKYFRRLTGYTPQGWRNS